MSKEKTKVSTVEESDQLIGQLPTAELKTMQNSQFLIFKDSSGKTKLDVRFDETDVWLTQDQMSELFSKSKSTINEHIKNIYTEGELEESSTLTKFGISELTMGRPVNHYNLDLIISVGYRVKSPQGTHFRRWATRNLHEFIQKGFVVDSERLKNPDTPYDYFEELEQIVQDIRTSERRFYLKITDIYATSIDYDKYSDTTQDFFATVQNKLHWAISGQTAAEIIYDRADSNKENMGLTSWRGQRIRKPDVSIAKNYLNLEEISALNDLVEQYLLFAETQARARIPMKMADWVTKLHGFLTLNDRDILTDAGKISHELAKERAEVEYENFRITQAKIPYNTDFEELLQLEGMQ
jgi:hypothetical protein